MKLNKNYRATIYLLLLGLSGLSMPSYIVAMEQVETKNAGNTIFARFKDGVKQASKAVVDTHASLVKKRDKALDSCVNTVIKAVQGAKTEDRALTVADTSGTGTVVNKARSSSSVSTVSGATDDTASEEDTKVESQEDRANGQLVPVVPTTESPSTFSAGLKKLKSAVASKVSRAKQAVGNAVTPTVVQEGRAAAVQMNGLAAQVTEKLAQFEQFLDTNGGVEKLVETKLASVGEKLGAALGTQLGDKLEEKGAAMVEKVAKHVRSDFVKALRPATAAQEAGADDQSAAAQADAETSIGSLITEQLKTVATATAASIKDAVKTDVTDMVKAGFAQVKEEGKAYAKECRTELEQESKKLATYVEGTCAAQGTTMLNAVKELVKEEKKEMKKEGAEMLKVLLQHAETKGEELCKKAKKALLDEMQDTKKMDGIADIIEKRVQKVLGKQAAEVSNSFFNQTNGLICAGTVAFTVITAYIMHLLFKDGLGNKPGVMSKLGVADKAPKGAGKVQGARGQAGAAKKEVNQQQPQQTAKSEASDKVLATIKAKLVKELVPTLNELAGVLDESAAQMTKEPASAA